MGHVKICCIAKSKLAKLLCAISKMKEETKRSREQMTEKPEVDNWDEEKQQGGRDKLGTPMLTQPEPHPPLGSWSPEERMQEVEEANLKNREETSTG